MLKKYDRNLNMTEEVIRLFIEITNKTNIIGILGGKT